MKSIVRILARLYPASWRARYGGEFDALLEEVTPSTRQALDVFLGAISMQITIWNFGKIVAVSTVVGLALASIGAAFGPTQYDSSVNIDIYGSDNEAQSLIDNFFRSTLSRELLTAVIERHNLYPQERGHESPDELVTRLQKAIVLRSVKENPPVRNVALEFTYSDPIIAQQVNGDLISKIVQGNFKMTMASHGGPRIEVVPARPSLPIKPSAPGEYSSSANFGFYGNDTEAQSLIDSLFKSALSRESLNDVIERHNLYPVERGHESPDELVTRMEKAITFHSVVVNPPEAPGMRSLTVDFKYPDPKIAQQVEGDIVSEFVSHNLTEREASPAGPPMELHVLNAPSLPTKPSGPGWELVTSGGAMIGALCGLGLASLMRFRRRGNAGAL